MSSCLIFHGPGAKAAAMQKAVSAGRLLAPPFGEDGLKTDDAREVVELLFSTPLGMDIGVIVVGPMDEANLKASDVLLKRILVAPRAAYAIEALFDYGLLTALLGCVPRVARFDRLVAIEAGLALPPDAALRLAALTIFVEEDVARLADRLRLSNAEQDVLALAIRDRADCNLPDEGAAKALLYRLGAVAYRSRMLLAWADSDAAPDDTAWRSALTLPERWQAPAFPLRGDDIVALGVQGPDIGAALRGLEHDWIESDFALTRDQLLAKAQELMTRS